MRKFPFNIYLFIGLTSIFPLIDFLNGLFLTSGTEAPIGVVYRFFFFLFLVIMIVLHPSSPSFLTFATFLFIIGNLLIWLFQGVFLQNPLSWMTLDISVFVKYFLWVLIPYYIYQRKDVFQIIGFDKLFLWISILFTLELLIPYLLGVGTHTYTASDAGYKGFFYAQNDVSYAFIILITLTGAQLLKEIRKKSKWMLPLLALYIGNIFCLLLIGTKTGVVYGATVTIYILIKLISGRHSRSLLQQIFIWLASLFAIFLLAYRGIQYAIDMLAGTVERMTYFYHLYNGDLVRLLSSSRSDFFEGGANAFLNDPHLNFTLLFGQGFEYRLENFGRLGLIEMDFFDAFFGLGIIGILLLTLVLGYYVWVALQKGNRSIYSFVLIVSLLYSFFAGHVLFSAVSSTFLGLICGAVLLQKNNYTNDSD
ncbi:O-antigen ligase family protein [Listeria booriae]|uniref:O-antigen ligase family protein n=1 Tax=Listeria booriae TaxID=1552123 RepID=UPI0016239688|nr:O-antigen ligase family protein [Listeria booriae]MBC2173354.1 hypothetical protein [Listeria booriae]